MQDARPRKRCARARGEQRAHAASSLWKDVARNVGVIGWRTSVVARRLNGDAATGSSSIVSVCAVTMCGRFLAAMRAEISSPPAPRRVPRRVARRVEIDDVGEVKSTRRRAAPCGRAKWPHMSSAIVSIYARLFPEGALQNWSTAVRLRPMSYPSRRVMRSSIRSGGCGWSIASADRAAWLIIQEMGAPEPTAPAEG